MRQAKFYIICFIMGLLGWFIAELFGWQIASWLNESNDPEWGLKNMSAQAENAFDHLLHFVGALFFFAWAAAWQGTNAVAEVAEWDELFGTK